MASFIRAIYVIRSFVRSSNVNSHCVSSRVFAPRSVQHFFRAATFIVFACAFRAFATDLPAGFTEALVASGFSSPTAMDFAPDGRLFVCEQNGAVRVVKNGALLPTPFATLAADGSNERGLLGIAVDPDFARNNFIYVFYTASQPFSHNRISRLEANGDVAVSETVIFEMPSVEDAIWHMGGALRFGP